MNNFNPVKILLAFIILAQPFAGYGGDTLSGKYPRAVLVQLRSEHNRIEALTKDKRYKDAEEVENDAIRAKDAMIYDLTKNFHYCPVYYYMDTNADLVKNKVFEGILTNADGSFASNPIINKNSTNYVIVYYGYPISQSRATSVVTDTSKYVYDPDQMPIKGFVILNDKFQQLGYVYKFGYYDITMRNKKTRKDYYASQHYDIEYYPLSELLNKKFKGYRIRRDNR